MTGHRERTEHDVRPVILAGGSGTRLWPLSREGYPKQLLCLNGQNTLFQDTVMRLDGLGQGVASEGYDPPYVVADPLIVCNEEHRFFIFEQLEALGRSAAQILLEPASRNTAPALTVAALVAGENGSDPVLVVMPADHVIPDTARFQEALTEGVELAARGFIVTFGVLPERPETGYGYIERGEPVSNRGGGFRVAAFREKPERATAESYVSSGKFFWNSGLFAVRALVWLDAIARHRPAIAEACRKAYQARESDGSFCRVGREAFEACPSESIDYAVMEQLGRSEPAHADATPATDGAAVVPLEAGWSDIGSWPALLALSGVEAEGNVVRGDVYADGASGSLLVSENRFLAALGVRDLVVVETPDAVLVADKSRCQDVRKVVEWLGAEGREEGKSHRRVYRPWGHYEQLESGERYQVKRLTVKPGAELSLQKHHHRAEHWVVVRGTARVTRDGEEFLLSENESTYIPIGTQHRLANPGKLPLEVIEVQSGSYLGEDDIVRLEDRYGREPKGR